MNEKTNGDSPAFAKAAFYQPDGGIDSPQEGLSKREYFAAMALQGYLSTESNSLANVTVLSQLAVHASDALIKALNETK